MPMGMYFAVDAVVACLKNGLGAKKHGKNSLKTTIGIKLNLIF